jgi:hypothetical protein
MDEKDKIKSVLESLIRVAYDLSSENLLVEDFEKNWFQKVSELEGISKGNISKLYRPVWWKFIIDSSSPIEYQQGFFLGEKNRISRKRICQGKELENYIEDIWSSHDSYFFSAWKRKTNSFLLAS